MKKTTIVSILMTVGLMIPAVSMADIIPASNGSPENVVNVWGTTNSGIPHVQPGQSVTDQWGAVSYCPAFLAQMKMYCVDISRTAYYINLHR